MIGLFGMFAVAVAMLYAAVSAQSTEGIVGKYGCTGTQQDGSSYSVTLTIEPAGENYNLLWSVPEGITGYGFGMLKNGALVAFFRTQAGDGIIHYTVGKSALHGTWTALGAEDTWSEVCTPGGQAQAV